MHLREILRPMLCGATTHVTERLQVRQLGGHIFDRIPLLRIEHLLAHQPLLNCTKRFNALGSASPDVIKFVTHSPDKLCRASCALISQPW